MLVNGLILMHKGKYTICTDLVLGSYILHIASI